MLVWTHHIEERREQTTAEYFGKKSCSLVLVVTIPTLRTLEKTNTKHSSLAALRAWFPTSLEMNVSYLITSLLH